MIILPKVELTLPRELCYEKTFVLDGKYYVLGGFFEWLMTSIDLNTFEEKNLVVHLEGDLQRSIVTNNPGYLVNLCMTYKGKVYAYMEKSMENGFVVQGRVESEGFHWRKIETTGMHRLMNVCVATFFEDEDRSSFCCLEHWNYELHLWRLNLDTLVWTDTTVSYCDQGERVNGLRIECIRGGDEVYYWRAWAAGSYVHFFVPPMSYDEELPAPKAHMILNLATMEILMDEGYNKQTTMSRELFPRDRFFSYQNSIWLIESANTVCAVHRYDSAAEQWNEIGLISGNFYIDSESSHRPCVVGTRVLFYRGHFSEQMRSDYIYTLELGSTLFDRAAVEIASSRELRRRAGRELPEHIRNILIERKILAEEHTDAEPDPEDSEDDDNDDDVVEEDDSDESNYDEDDEAETEEEVEEGDEEEIEHDGEPHANQETNVTTENSQESNILQDDYNSAATRPSMTKRSRF